MTTDMDKLIADIEVRIATPDGDYESGHNHGLRDAIALIRKHQAEQGVDHTRVNIPVSENEAVLMAAMGTDWLERKAPHRLKQAEQQGVDELLAWVKESAETIVYHYPNPELNHVDFRVRACQIAEEITQEIAKRIRPAEPVDLPLSSCDKHAQTMPHFTLIAKDNFACNVVEVWIELAQKHKLPDSKIKAAKDTVSAMRRWRMDNPDQCKIPD